MSFSTSDLLAQLSSPDHSRQDKTPYYKHPYYEKFIIAGCLTSVFEQIVECSAVKDYDALYTGFTKIPRRFRESLDTLGLMLCMSRDTNVIQYAIDKNLINIDLENCHGDSFLHLAALSGSQAVVEHLIKTFHIDPKSWETGAQATALHYAAMSNDTTLLNYLLHDQLMLMPLDSVNHVGHHALDYACIAGALEAIDYLHKSGLHPHLDQITHLIFNGAPNAKQVFEKLKDLNEMTPGNCERLSFAKGEIHPLNGGLINTYEHDDITVSSKCSLF